jgi:CNT family concentrative nucleoside transporter
VIMDASQEGSRFVFGNLVDHAPDRWGFVFAARALPTIIVFSSLSAIGYHFGVLQRVVGAMAWVMLRLMRVSGAESLSAAGNVFLGQTEAPLLVRPYIPHMTTSELNAVMIGGFATIAGSLMAVYASMLGHTDRGAVADMVRHLLTASLMSAPAGLVVAKILVPERDVPRTAGMVRMQIDRDTRNVIDAAAQGAADGLRLALNVGGMLIAFIALIRLVDAGLGWLGGIAVVGRATSAVGMERLELNALLGLVFAPVAWLVGAPAGEVRAFGALLGQAMAANEFLAYRSLAELIAVKGLSPRAVTLAIYALCGFANFSSIAIQIAGIGGMAPDRRHDLARLGLRAMFGGAIACWMTACVAGALI